MGGSGGASFCVSNQPSLAEMGGVVKIEEIIIAVSLEVEASLGMRLGCLRSIQNSVIS